MAVVVIGGTVLDIQAQPTAAHIQRGSSVPGHVVQLPGGVGRNIAEATHHLCRDKQGTSAVLLISVIGQDTAADALLASFAHLGLSTRGIIRSASAATPCVVAILDRDGEVAASVADVAAPAAELTPGVVRRHAAAIAAAQLLVLDANLQQDTLQAAAAVAAASGVPVLFEPVSVPKAPRCVPFLHTLSAITPNTQELLAIAAAVQEQRGRLPLVQLSSSSSSSSHGGASPQQLLAQLAPAAAVVLQEGLGCIILTLGASGAALLTLHPHTGSPHNAQHHHYSQHQHQQQQQQQLCSHHVLQQQDHHHQQQQQVSQQGLHEARSSSSLSPAARALLLHHKTAHHAKASGRLVLRAQHIPAAPAAVVNLSGAGDTLIGALAAALLRGRDPLHALAVGVAAAAVTVGCSLNVPGPEEGLVFDRVEAAGLQLLQQQQVWEFPVQAML